MASQLIPKGGAVLLIVLKLCFSAGSSIEED